MSPTLPQPASALVLGRTGLLIGAVLFALSACDIPPNHVEGRDIDDALARGKFATVCKGLEMKDDDVRKYATERMITVEEPIAAECVCKFIAHPTKGWDASIASGLQGTQREDVAQCFADLVKKPDLPKRTEAIGTLATIPARAARTVLGEIAAAPGDAEARTLAIKAVGGLPDQKDSLVRVLGADEDASIRAAAAAAVGGYKSDDAVLAALNKASTDDAEGAVRANALRSLRKLQAEGIDERLCTAMMEDPSPDVRSAAVAAFKGTKRAEAVACLRKRALTLEEDSGVRTQLLAVLKSSPSDDAAKVLCDAIPFWLKSYLKEDIPDKVPGTDIIGAQNDRDWERSYECVGKAYQNSGGYSCFARLYSGWWYRRLGGNAHLPNCPGYEHEDVSFGG